MRTIIFSTHQEAEVLQNTLGGMIFTFQDSRSNLIKYLNENEDAVIICAGDVMQMGWSTYHPCIILFSADFTTNEAHRFQAKGRVRT